jgi:hypothetical protein
LETPSTGSTAAVAVAPTLKGTILGSGDTDLAPLDPALGGNSNIVVSGVKGASIVIPVATSEPVHGGNINIAVASRVNIVSIIGPPIPGVATSGVKVASVTGSPAHCVKRTSVPVPTATTLDPAISGHGGVKGASIPVPPTPGVKDISVPLVSAAGVKSASVLIPAATLDSTISGKGNIAITFVVKGASVTVPPAAKVTLDPNISATSKLAVTPAVVMIPAKDFLFGSDLNGLLHSQ